MNDSTDYFGLQFSRSIRVEPIISDDKSTKY